MQQQYAQAQYSPRQLLESARRAEADGNVDLAIHVSRYVLEHFAGSPESAEAYNSLVRLGQAAQEQPSAHGAHQPAMANGYAAQGQPAPPARFNAPVAAPPAAAAWSAPQPMQPAAFAPMMPLNRAANGAHPGSPSNGGANGYANGSAHYPAPAPAAARAPTPTPGNGAYAGQMQTPVQAIAATFAPAAPYRGAETQPPAMIHHAPEVTPQYRGGRIVARFTFVAGGLMMFAGVMSPLPALLGLLGASPSITGMVLVAGALIATGLLALLGAQTALAVFDQADNMRELVELERTRWTG